MTITELGMRLNEDMIVDHKLKDGELLIEDVCYLEYSPEDLCEGKDGKRPYLKGRLGWVDKPTANKRVYPRKIMERELSKLNDDMKARKIYGESDHPQDGKTQISRVSHFVTNAEITENGEIIGTLEFIPGTKNGEQVLSILRAGGIVGVSSRGRGTLSTDKNGYHVVNEDYQLDTWDVVANPANAGAYPSFVMEDIEGDNMDIETLKKEKPDVYEKLVSSLKEEIEAGSREHAREALREEFETKLLESRETIRKEAVEKAREELLEDPEVAGAVKALGAIKELVIPYVLDEDENKELARLKKELSEAHATIAKQDEKISELNEENVGLAKIAKEFGFTIHLERTLKENDRMGQIVEMVGDLDDYEDLEELEKRVSDISAALAEEDDKHAKYKKDIEDLQKENKRLIEERDRALRIGKEFGINAYIKHVCANNPHRGKLAKHLIECKPESKEKVDKLVEDFMASNPVSKTFKDVRRGLSRIRSEKIDMNEENIDDKEGITEDDDLLGGVPISELLRLSN